MLLKEIKNKLRVLTSHSHIVITSRGDTAIKAALSLRGGITLIPSEGGWLSYKKLPKEPVEIKCNSSVIDLTDFKKKIIKYKPAKFLYQNPGGYFATQPMQEIYELCQEHNCLVIMDASGSIGTSMCNGNYADVLVGSFGKWKLIDAGKGGFISFKDKSIFEKLEVKEFSDEEFLRKINEKLETLSQRITFLSEKRKRIIEDLKNFNILRENDFGFVVIVVYRNDLEKEKIIDYCKKNNLEYTFCPRYIRVNRKAISIEVKKSTEK